MSNNDNFTEDPTIRLAALEQSSEAVVIVDSHQHVRYFNEAAESVWGVNRADVLGCDAVSLGLTALTAQADTARAACDTAACSRNSEIEIGRKDGSQIRAAMSVSHIQFGCEGCTIAFVRDITREVERREEMALLTAISDRTSRAVVVTDHEQTIVYSNTAFTALFGYSSEEAKGRHASELLAGRYTDQIALDNLKTWTHDDHGGEQEILLYDKNGDEIWVQAEVKALRNARGQIRHGFAMLTDISESKQLRSLQQLTRAALADELPIAEIGDRLCRQVEKIAPDVVSSLLHIDAAGLIHPLGGPSLPTDYSQALDGVAIGPDVGSCGSAAYYGKPVLAIDLDADPRWQPYKARPLSVGLRACWSSPIKSKDGRVIGTFAFYFRESREPSRWHQRIIEACVDLGALAIERKESSAQIARLAYHDMLTGLPNRARLRDLIAEATEACPADEHVALAFLDVDNFKDVNDTLGHSAGDEFLIEFARRLREQILPGDMLGRLGGDEFVVVMPNRDAAAAGRIAERLSDAVTMPLRIGARQVPMSASIGISLYPDNTTDLDTLIRQADTAMYQAKRAGRSTYRFFSAEMNGIAEERMAYTAALRRAIAQDGLELRYQPQISTADGAIHGVEALARWCDPLLGEISPAKFIPLAEECGLIDHIAVWSIRAACRQMLLWRNQGLDIPCVSVNLSPINFQNANLPSVVADCLAEHRLPPEVLMLEVTEGVLEKERSRALATMNALRALGVGLSLDDFGTGYSSLSRLAQLPIRELKIDRGFMSDVETDDNTRAIVTTVVRVGQSLRLNVIAEGVETEGQLALLTELGCDIVQGFLYAPALLPCDLERWLLDYTARRASAMARRLHRAVAPSTQETPHLAPPMRHGDGRALQL
ncbi:EAL domain-containing protein [Rhodopseudomonas sp.]|uniref:EAL domain-containing protein n=1 Tax=Rhodopseudomonas sp. TaxID=1078 RepID=UPI003B3BA179